MFIVECCDNMDIIQNPYLEFDINRDSCPKIK